ncbi:hypothetical protein BE963_00915 (plasmid) [Escherichia coli]|nr:hypothetical protein BE963_00915 [Escherichia coli]
MSLAQGTESLGCHFALSRNRPLKRLDDFHHVLPWQNLLHAGQENLFSGLTALTAEFTVGEGKLMTHDEPCSMAPDDKHDLISGTCSHLP